MDINIRTRGIASAWRGIARIKTWRKKQQQYGRNGKGIGSAKQP